MIAVVDAWPPDPSDLVYWVNAEDSRYNMSVKVSAYEAFVRDRNLL